MKDILLGFNEKQSFGNFCTEDFGGLWYGRQYIIDLPFKLVPSMHGQLFFLVEYGLNYRFTFHDRSFYMLNDNPVAFPTIIKIFNPNKTFNNLYRIALTEVEELDLPEDPCNTDPDYNFQACVRESLSSQVGCRTKWDRWSHKDIPLC